MLPSGAELKYDELSKQKSTMGVPLGAASIFSFRAGVTASIESLEIFQPLWVTVNMSSPRFETAIERFFACEPPTIMHLSTSPLRRAQKRAGFFMSRYRFGSLSTPASNFEFTSASRSDRNFLSIAWDQI